MFPTIPQRPDDRPWLVKAVPWIALLSGASWGISSVASLAGAMPRERIKASLGMESPLSAGLLWAGATLAVFLIAFAFWRKHPWSRHLLIAFFAVEVVRQMVWQTGLGELLLLTFVVKGFPSSLIIFIFLIWYFYWKPNVRAYYRSLKPGKGFEMSSARSSEDA